MIHIYLVTTSIVTWRHEINNYSSIRFILYNNTYILIPLKCIRTQIILSTSAFLVFQRNQLAPVVNNDNRGLDWHIRLPAPQPQMKHLTVSLTLFRMSVHAWLVAKEFTTHCTWPLCVWPLMNLTMAKKIFFTLELFLAYSTRKYLLSLTNVDVCCKITMHCKTLGAAFTLFGGEGASCV